MTNPTGKINVQTENIFPIIKKFLYSDHEIFLRELVANAVDATQKFSALNRMAEKPVESGDLYVEVKIDKENKTLHVIDRGVGMTGEEVEKYINQIAFSGAEEFVNKYKDQSGAQLIGKFGLGFYSAFMVSDHVALHSRSWLAEEGDAVRWTCDGSPSYNMEKLAKDDRGTEVILSINDDSIEFLEPARIRTLLNKYCGFLPVEIRFEGEKINNTAPAWVKKPAELTDEDYKAFYKELYPFAEEPLFWIHLNVDFPFNLTGILYFPKLKKNLEVQKNKIQLYCRQVFVTDAVEGIVPDFLTLLHGVIDSPDIPLNVSRSYLQSDSNVKKISNHILKKVADKLEELFKENRNDFEAKWDDIGVFIKYGMLSEEKFFERANKFCLLKNVDKKYFTFEEYRNLISLNQEDKDKKVIYLYTTNPEDQYAYINSAKKKGYDVLWMDGVIDTHFVNFIEQKVENGSFARVDADTIDKLISKEENRVSKLTEEEQTQLKELVETVVNKDTYHVSVSALSEDDAHIVLTRPEFMRRMKEMSASGGGGYSFMGEMPDQYNMVLNSNHPFVGKILSETDTTLKSSLMQQAVDLALLNQGLLKGEALSDFTKRSIDLLNK
ncbi:MAG: molecular chaperone HtpG [Bacteroidia bacterium]|jgi:molecular chaperone HtpG|nr:molecular chaperone HtpG [Bacteroidota bacterium]MBP6512181.1 molecular chaperone HtpG [Bacteroidia bacterium]MBP7243829.1 molecular chaperone HtpG [Bacteroidia bacterium]